MIQLAIIAFQPSQASSTPVHTGQAAVPDQGRAWDRLPATRRRHSVGSAITGAAGGFVRLLRILRLPSSPSQARVLSLSGSATSHESNAGLEANAGPAKSGEASPSSPFDLAETYRTERPRLLRYFTRRAGHDLAPDLVQEVFARAAGSSQSGELSNPAGFIQRIARNLLINLARSRNRHTLTFLPIDEERDLAAPPEQEQGLQADDLLRLYHEALDELPPKTREVFLMHRVEELSYRQIHERLGITVSTVEYHMMKALRHIASHVDAANSSVARP